MAMTVDELQVLITAQTSKFNSEIAKDQSFYINEKGEVVIPAEYSYVTMDGGGLIFVKK